jgi:hypothetical protein
MIGKLTSVENGPERNVKLVVTASELHSEISSPAGSFDPHSVDHYKIAGLQERDTGLVTLTFVLASGQRVRFYCTESKFDMALLLDQLDGTIGERRREFLP